MTHKILLITNSYPSSNSIEKNFIHKEVESLIDLGFSVSVMPFYYSGSVDRSFRGRLIDSLSKKKNLLSFSSSFIYMLFRRSFWRELFANYSLIFTSVRRIKNLFKYSLKSEVVRRVLLEQSNGRYDVVYTYWCSGESIAVAELVDQNKINVYAITRMHGFDIYEERDCNNGYIPYRKETLSALDKIIVLSEQAKNYLVSKYPKALNKIYISPLGVDVMPEQPKVRWVNGFVSFFSCSYPASVKRLDKIFEVVVKFAMLNHETTIHWSHFGCDEAESMLAIRDLPENLTVTFYGRTARATFMQHYCNAATPLFINMSDSEGQPVSIMEAMSCGLPVVATEVGGVSDVLGLESGILVDATDDISSIAARIEGFILDQNVYLYASSASIKRQRECYDVQKNHYRLSKKLRTWCE